MPKHQIAYPCAQTRMLASGIKRVPPKLDLIPMKKIVCQTDGLDFTICRSRLFYKDNLKKKKIQFCFEKDNLD